MSLLVLALSFTSLISIVGAQEAENRCPDVLRFVSEEQDRWFGELSLQSEFALSGLWVRAVLDRKARLLGTTFDAEIKTDDNLSYLIRKPDFSLTPNEVVTIPFFIRYSELESSPRIQNVYLNGRQVCPTPFPPPRISPCPNVFLFDDRDENDRWFGQLSLKSDVNLQGVWVKVIFDTKVDLVGSKFGDVKSEDNQQYLFFDRDYKLDVGKTLIIPFFVKYSLLSTVPQIQSIRLNARTVCGQLIDT